MLRTLRTLARLLSIVRTLRRYDVLAPFRETGIIPWPLRLLSLFGSSNSTGRPGERLAQALTELGPSFIKLGQVLSTRADLLGEQMAIDLADLHDRLPAFDSSEARATIGRELGRSVEDLFDSFEDVPVSAASIAQVHFAMTRSEQEDRSIPVAVKVLRPGIEQAIERDLELFYTLARLAERTQPKLRRFKPVEVVRLFEEIVRVELDLRLEAAALSEMAGNFADDPTYCVPSVDWVRSSQRVLTMGRLSGIPIDDRDALIEAGHNLDEVLTNAATIFFKQAFRDGFFHGDQHPGNMWVDPAGNIVAVDFGIMGRLEYRTRCYLADMMAATLERDYLRLAEIHVEAGYLPRGASRAHFSQALRSVCEPIIGRPLEQISFARLLAQLLQLTESYSLPVQPQLLLLQKNMLMAEGISRRLNPGLNIWLLAQPLIETWMRENRSPEARVLAGMGGLVSSLERLPETLADLEATASDLSRSGLRVHVDSLKAFASGDRQTSRHLRLIWFGLAFLGLLILLD